MMFIYRPQTPSSRVVNARSPSPSRHAYHNYDPDEAFVEFKRREYIAALEEAEQRAQFRRELAAEEERHRRALQHIAAQESVRRQHATALMEELAQRSQQVDELRQAQRAQRALQERQEQERQARQATETQQAQRAPQAHQSYLQPHAHRHSHPNHPSPQEILRRRLERQKEEERRSREFHRRILNDIFGVPVEISESQTPVQRPTELPKEAQVPQQQQAYEPEQPEQTEKEEEPHWSEAPLRNRALAEIAAINRAFISLKNTFIFPAGQLERAADTPAPKLAYNPTNAAIHAYEHALSDLLSKLDGIDSHGFKGVRMARKQLVVKIEEELLALERKIAENLAPAPASGVAAAAPAEPASTNAPSTAAAEPVSTDAPSTAAEPAEPAARDVEMTEPAAAAPSHTPNPGGYDVEVEDVFVAPTPKTNTDTTTAATTATTTTTEQEREEPITLVEAPEVPSQGPQDRAASDADIQMVAAPTSEPTAEPAAPSTPPAKHKTTISVSDEEDEVDDAVHVITSEDGTKAKSGQEEGYELL